MRRFYSEKGVLNIDDWSAPTYNAQGGPRRDGKIRGENKVLLVDRPDHYLNWLQCMRTGGTPQASIEAGFQHAVAVLMAVKAYDTGRKTTYDRERRVINIT